MNNNGRLALRQRVSGANSSAEGRRDRRLRWLAETFPSFGEMSVLDLGGRVGAWVRAPVRPAHVHVVNLEEAPKEMPEWAEFNHGDACDLPGHILKRHYDLIFSNSVIEHVGGHDRRVRFADAVHQLGDAHWVQTPYRYFPIEPHWLMPAMQFMPVTVRARVVRRSPFAYKRAETHREAVRRVLQIELIDRTQMRYYFPDSVLRTEWYYGIPKSLIAYHGGS